MPQENPDRDREECSEAESRAWDSMMKSLEDVRRNQRISRKQMYRLHDAHKQMDVRIDKTDERINTIFLQFAVMKNQLRWICGIPALVVVLMTFLQFVHWMANLK